MYICICIQQNTAVPCILGAIWVWIWNMDLYNYHRLLREQTRNDVLQVIAPLYNKLHSSPVYSWQFRDEFGIWIYTTTTDYYRQETMCYKWTAKKGFKAVIIQSGRKSTWLCYSVNPPLACLYSLYKKTRFPGLNSKPHCFNERFQLSCVNGQMLHLNVAFHFFSVFSQFISIIKGR